MLIDNGWYLILENITCGYGNHARYIEFISRMITITTRDIFQYQIPAIIYLPITYQHRGSLYVYALARTKKN